MGTSRNFVVLFHVYDLFHVIFVQYKVRVKVHLFLSGYSLVPAQFVEKFILSTLKHHGTLDENQFTISYSTDLYVYSYDNIMLF